MSVPSNLNKITYNGNDATTSWSYTFPIILSTDIEVILTDASGVDQSPLTSNYSVDTINSVVTYPISGSPLPTGWKITLLRVEPLTQLTTLTTQGAFSAANIERALDKVTMILQQHDEIFSRVPAYPVSQTPSSTDTTTFINTVAAYAAAAAAFAGPTASVKTADYSIAVSDYGKLLIMNSASAHTFTLPAISTNALVFIKNIGAGLLTVAKTGADTLETASVGTNEVVILAADTTNKVWRDISIKCSKKGADVASASTMTLGDDGDFFNITGTTSITSITAKAAGKCVRMKFAGALTMVTGGNINMASSLTTASGTVLTMVSDGTNWWEVSRTGGGGGTSSAVRGTFTSGTLSSNILTITHNLGLSSPYSVNVSIYNNSNVLVIPDQVNTLATNSVKVDLTSYATISGTWSYVVSG